MRAMPTSIPKLGRPFGHTGYALVHRDAFILQGLERYCVHYTRIVQRIVQRRQRHAALPKAIGLVL